MCLQGGGPCPAVIVVRLEKTAADWWWTADNALLGAWQMLWLFLVFAHVVGSLWWSIGVATFNKLTAFGRPTGVDRLVSGYVSLWAVRTPPY